MGLQKCPVFMLWDLVVVRACCQNLCDFETFISCCVPNGSETPGRRPPCDAPHSFYHTFQATASHSRLGVEVPACIPGCTWCGRAPDFMSEYEGTSGTPPGPAGPTPREEAWRTLCNRAPRRRLNARFQMFCFWIRMHAGLSGNTPSVQNCVFLNAHHHSVPSTSAWPTGGGVPLWWSVCSEACIVNVTLCAEII